MRTVFSQILENSPVTNADVFSPVITIDQVWAYAVQAEWTGSAIAGTIQLEASVDGTHWATVNGSAETVSGPGSYLWNVTIAAYSYFRLHFVYASGSGNISAYFQTKGSN